MVYWRQVPVLLSRTCRELTALAYSACSLRCGTGLRASPSALSSAGFNSACDRATDPKQAATVSAASYVNCTQTSAQPSSPAMLLHCSTRRRSSSRRGAPDLQRPPARGSPPSCRTPASRRSARKLPARAAALPPAPPSRVVEGDGRVGREGVEGRNN